MAKAPRMSVRIAQALKQAREWRRYHQNHVEDEAEEAEFKAMIAWLSKR